MQESVADEVIAKLWERMRRLRVGDPLDKNTDVGAINSAEQLERIEALVAAGEEEGAVRRTIACELPERGYWFAPTLFTDVAPAHRIAVEEIFGPVVSVLTFRTPGRGDREGQQLALRAGRRASGPTRASKAFEVAARAAGRRRLAEHLQPASTRRRRSAATRSRASAARAAPPACVPTCACHDAGSAVRKTYKL